MGAEPGITTQPFLSPRVRKSHSLSLQMGCQYRTLNVWRDWRRVYLLEHFLIEITRWTCVWCLPYLLASPYSPQGLRLFETEAGHPTRLSVQKVIATEMYLKDQTRLKSMLTSDGRSLKNHSHKVIISDLQVLVSWDKVYRPWDYILKIFIRKAHTESFVSV